MSEVKIYSTGTCPICDKAKTLMTKWGIAYDEIRIDKDQDGLREMLEISNHARTVPQIVIKDKWIGGFSELTELHMDGALDDLPDK
ncbi:MAG: hypothetical protein BMS9Abin26_0811 [Gammaproteobacteria bacterium]|nr:MAG: hypothetical protein BMS9Abin26_0811 [Gammaproteobacteria bacterium]